MSRLQTLTDEWVGQGLLLPIHFRDGQLVIVDQLALPDRFEYLEIDSAEDLCAAIRRMVIRGSGAIGTCGVYGMILAARGAGDGESGRRSLQQAAAALKSTRPTAINLHKTVDEMLGAIPADGRGMAAALEERACTILERQLRFEQQLGEYGAALLRDGDGILTHCHSGALAGSGYGGRALSVLRKAHEQGKQIHVYSSETRPYLQGARITVFELQRFGIEHTLITDGMSGHLMRLGRVQACLVGSDRVAANGDLINKVGTYMHALAAHDNGVPFYTATSSHTIDHQLATGLDHQVEFRSADEVTHVHGRWITVPGTDALYPSFDVTPHRLLSGIITEAGVLRAPFTDALRSLRGQETTS